LGLHSGISIELFPVLLHELSITLVALLAEGIELSLLLCFDLVETLLLALFDVFERARHRLRLKREGKDQAAKNNYKTIHINSTKLVGYLSERCY
jgi:hypothetical protein